MDYHTAEFDVYADRQEILNLWGRNLPMGSYARFDWLYQSDRAAGWTIGTDDGAAVGAAGVMTREMRISGHPVRAGQAIDLNVDAEHRTLGPAVRLQRLLTSAVASGRFSLVYAFPNVQSSAVLRRIGYKRLADVQRWCCPLRAQGFLESRLNQPVVRKLAAVATDSTLRCRRWAATRIPLGNRSVDVADQFDRRFDRLWQSAADRFSVIGERTSTYLDWRFGRSPSARYRTFCLSSSNGRLLAYVVYCRSEQMVHVNDFFFNDVAELRCLLAAFLRRMDEEKASVVSVVYLGPDRVGQVFRQLGFLRRPAPWTALVYANGPPQGLTVDEMLDANRWYLTRADIDTDL